MLIPTNAWCFPTLDSARGGRYTARRAYGTAQVAQLVEQWTENPRVGGSNPPLGTTFSRKLPLFSVATRVNVKIKCARYAGMLSIAVTQL